MSKPEQIEVLEKAIKKNKGKFVLTLNLGKEKGFKKENLAGVTWKLAIDFVKSCSEGGSDKYYFLNNFQLKEDKEVTLPKSYKIDQSKHSSDFELSIKNSKPADDKDKLKKQFMKTRKLIYTPSLNLTDHTASDDKNLKVKTLEGGIEQVCFTGKYEKKGEGTKIPLPCYLVITLSGAEEKHVIALGMRSDIEAKEKVKPYEYFDPEVGLVIFDSFDLLMKFVTESAYPELYQKDYPNFEIDAFALKVDDKETTTSEASGEIEDTEPAPPPKKSTTKAKEAEDAKTNGDDEAATETRKRSNTI